MDEKKGGSLLARQREQEPNTNRLCLLQPVLLSVAEAPTAFRI